MDIDRSAQKFVINRGGNLGDNNDFAIDYAGNVGIGTSSPDPAAKLDVNGNIKVTGNINMGGATAYKVTNLAAPTAAADAMTKGYADSTYATYGWVSSNFAPIGGSGSGTVLGGGNIYNDGSSGSCTFCAKWGSAVCVETTNACGPPSYTFSTYSLACPAGSTMQQTGRWSYSQTSPPWTTATQNFYICVKN
ncbi:hypothetical protein HY640_04995 [Candidatus Woesearchaeota archaeon]|nr:hypothetical protein [Candidatus Woesearchaeota archaeon]